MRAEAELIETDQSGTPGLEDNSAAIDQGSRRPAGKARRGKTIPAYGSYSEFNPSSGALALWPSELDYYDLPTQTRKYAVGKRAFDIALAVVIFPIVATVLLIIGALIALTSGWPVFYRQRRIGQHGQEFDIWKFRTMHLHGDRILREHLKRNPAARLEWQHTHKLRNDPRITPMGRFLRKTSLDELPQILNVLTGEMSFVGPRPIVEAETAKYAERFSYYLAAVPGITGLWQVSGRCNVSYATRVILDETYVRKWSLLRDLWILMKTPKAVCCRHGAY